MTLLVEAYELQSMIDRVLAVGVKADLGRYWVDPFGVAYTVDEAHWDWVADNHFLWGGTPGAKVVEDAVKEYQKWNTSDTTSDVVNSLVGIGWSRVYDDSIQTEKIDAVRKFLEDSLGEGRASKQDRIVLEGRDWRVKLFEGSIGKFLAQ